MAETAPLVKTKTTGEILERVVARDLLQDIFADLHPALLDETRDLSSIFTSQSAGEFLAQLTNFETLISHNRHLRRVRQEVPGADRRRRKDARPVTGPGIPADPAHRAELTASCGCSSKTPRCRTARCESRWNCYVLNADAKGHEGCFSA